MHPDRTHRELGREAGGHWAAVCQPQAALGLAAHWHTWAWAGDHEHSRALIWKPQFRGPGCLVQCSPLGKPGPDAAPVSFIVKLPEGQDTSLLTQEWSWHGLEKDRTSGLELAPSSPAPMAMMAGFVGMWSTVEISSPETGQTSPTGFYFVLKPHLKMT